MRYSKKKVYVAGMKVSAAQQKYLNCYFRRQQKIRICQICILIVFIALWETSTRAGLLNDFIFSSPSRVVSCFVDMLLHGNLSYHIGITLAETFISFILVNVIGLMIAVFLWWNEGAAKVSEPYLIVLNSLPKTALAPVFIVWLGSNMKTIIVAAISVAVFGTIITLYTDFKAVEADKIKLIRTLGGTKKDVLWKVILPANFGSLISVMKVNIGLSLVGVIIGEFLAAKAGLGYLIIYGSQVFKLDWVIMSIVILCALATLLYRLLTCLEKKYIGK